MIELRNQYKIDIDRNGGSFPYDEEETGKKRISQICRTTRGGFKYKQFVGELWSFFKEIRDRADEIPSKDFDTWHKDKIEQLSQLIGNKMQWKIGISQKLLNLFLKDLWAWGKLDDEVVKQLHPPLDRYILSLIGQQVPDSWKSWTKVECTEGNFANSYQEYLAIRDNLVDLFSKLDTCCCLIEKEQCIWSSM